MQATLQNNLHSIKHNKEFRLTRERVHLVFVIHNEGVFGTSAQQNKNGTSETMCFEKMMHAGADMGEWIAWLAKPPFGDPTPPPKKKQNQNNIGTPWAGISLHFSG